MELWWIILAGCGGGILLFAYLTFVIYKIARRRKMWVNDRLNVTRSITPTLEFWRSSVVFQVSRVIGHFRITLGLFLKASPGAQPLTWKLVHMQMKTNPHKKGWAPGPAPKKRLTVIWKWPIIMQGSTNDFAWKLHSRTSKIESQHQKRKTTKKEKRGKNETFCIVLCILQKKWRSWRYISKAFELLQVKDYFILLFWM